MNEKKLSHVDAAIASVYLRSVIDSRMDAAQNFRAWAQDHRAAGCPGLADAYDHLAKSTDDDVAALQRVLEYLG